MKQERETNPDRSAHRAGSCPSPWAASSALALRSPKGIHLGVCAPCPSTCPTPTSSRSSAEDPGPWGRGGKRDFAGQGVISATFIVLKVGFPATPTRPHLREESSEVKWRVLRSKGGGDGDSPAARLSWKGRLIPESAPATAQRWGRGFPAGSHLPPGHPKFCPAPPSQAQGWRLRHSQWQRRSRVYSAV